jgi:hypothetical protein
MPLLALWRSNPEQISAYRIRQILMMAGEGKLLDGSVCSTELRTYLSEVEAAQLDRFANECLEVPFDDSGLVLQDVVNEIGRRLEFQVEAGLYRGRRGTPGFDGVWRSGAHQFVVEVKTTDAYRIPLHQTANYREQLIKAGELGEDSSILFVVGREDTQGLEEQIRGSRHAWSMRVIGVSSLIRLLMVKVKSESDEVIERIQSLLRPVEYTRLDGIVDLMFKATTEAVADSSSAAEAPEEDQDTPIASEDSTGGAHRTRAPSSPAAPGMEAVRERAAEALAGKLGVRLTRRRRSNFVGPDDRVRAVIAVSKRYHRDYQAYWYGLYDTHAEFLADAESGYLVLCGMDTCRAWSLPYSFLAPLLARLKQTVRDEGQRYWHIALKLVGEECRLVVTGAEIPLTDFELLLRGAPADAA